jgi:hypothetical protein
MNKFGIVIVIIAVVTLALGTVGVAYAQFPPQTPSTATGVMAGSGFGSNLGGANISLDGGILDEYMIAAYADALKISEVDLKARLDNGETMVQIALSEGMTFEQIRTIMVEVRTQAFELAKNDGVLTQAQVEWMAQTSSGQMAGGQMGNGSGMYSDEHGQFTNPNRPCDNKTKP